MSDPLFKRKGRRLLVEFLDDLGTKRTGYTRDLSFTGLFIVADQLPPDGPLTLTVHLPRGRMVNLNGRVVRRGRGTSAVSGSAPIGFGFALDGYSEDFTQLVSGL